MSVVAVMKVLIVEEQLGVRKALERLLESIGVRFQSVSSAAQAQREVQAQRPDLILSSLTLPDQGGLELCRALSDDCKVVLLGVVDTAAAQAVGAVGTLHLPVERAELQTLLRSLFGPMLLAADPAALTPLQARIQQVLARPGMLALSAYDASGQVLCEFGERLPGTLGQQAITTFEELHWLSDGSPLPCTMQIECGARCLLLVKETGLLLACLLRDSASASVMKYWLSTSPAEYTVAAF